MKKYVITAIVCFVAAIAIVGVSFWEARLDESTYFRETFGVGKSDSLAAVTVYSHLHFMSNEACYWVRLSNQNPQNKAASSLKDSSMTLLRHAVDVAKENGFNDDHGELGAAAKIVKWYGESAKNQNHVIFSCN